MGTYDIFKKRYAKEQTVKPASSASKKTEKVETAKPETVEAEKPSSGMRSLDYFYNHTKAPEPVKANTLESLSASVTPAAGIVHGGRGRSFGMQRPVTAEASNEPARKRTVRPEFADQGISSSRGDTQILTGEPYNLTREGQWAAKHPIAGTLMYGVSNLVGGAEGFINTGEAALRALATGQKFNPNNIHAAPIAQGFRTGAAEGVRRNIQENTPGFASAVGIDSRDGRYTFGEKAADFLSGVGADAVSSSISMATGGPLSTALMGGSAANQNLYETSQDENTTARQAAALATANGIAEAFFEHFSVERLLNFRNPTSTAQAIRTALAQAGVEASEEMFTEIANTLSDIAIRRDYSERGREYQDYIKQGMDPNTAATNTMRSAVTQIFLAGLGGALSGGLHTGAAIAGNTFTGGRNMRTDIRNGITLEDIAGSIDTSTAEGQRVKDIANDIAQREAAGRTASTAELGYLSNAIANAADVAEENEAKAAASQTAPVEDVASETTPQENIPERRAVTQMMNDVAAETAKDTGEAFRNANYYNSQRMTAGERIFNAEMAEDMASTFGEEGQKAFSALPAEEGVKAYREWAAHYNNMRFGMPIREGMSTTLSPEQISAAMRAGALDANRAYPQDTMKAVNRAVNKISVNGVNAGNTDLSGIDYKSLTPQQKLRVDYTSTFITKGLGMDVRYVKSEAVDGKYKGMNGSFQVINGRPTITLDVNAGMNRESDWTGDITDIKSMLPVISHETTHFLEQYNPKLYKELSNTVLTALQNNGTYSKGMTINSIIEAERQRLNDTIKDENGKPVQHTQDDAIHELVARACEDMLSGDKKALDAFNSLDANTKQTLWDHVKQVFDNIREFFSQMLSSYKSDSAEAKAIRQNMEEFEKIRDMWMNALDGSHAEDIGINIDTATESAAPTGPELSYRSWNASDWVQYKKEAAKELADALGVSTKTATKYINDVNSVAKMIFDDQVRLDYDSSEGRSAFVSNTEYGGSIDFSTLCKKRLLYTGTIQAIQNLLPNTALTPAEYLQIRQMMLDAGHEVTCGLCYVEGSRVKMGVYTKEFIEKYKKTNPEYVPTMAEMNTPDGQEKLRSEHPEVYDAYVYFMNHYGTLSKGEKALFASQQKPKLYTLRTEYKGEIKKKFGGAKNRASVADKNLNGGLRIQSFSDFEIVHMIDMMQVIMDMSEAGLAGQAYTKVPEFADSFGRTGLKINCSLITKGVDENGNLIFDDREGMNHERAFELRDKYSKNVGTVLVVFNQEQLRAALADDRIDYVLPFHKSQWTSEQYDAIGLPEGTIDFTNYQNDYIKGAKSKENVMPMEYWDFSKSGRENAERYLQICAEEGRTPKFARIRGENLLIDNGDGTWSLPDGPLGDGYFKLLIDFKMYDNNGKGARQMPVRPNFSMDEIRTALNDYKGGHRSFPVANDIVQEFVDNYKKQNPRAEYSDRDISEERYESLTDKQKKNYNFNQKQSEVGSSLRTLNGSRIERSRYGVGKDIGGQLYVHKDYAEEVVPKEELTQAMDILKEAYPDFKYNAIMYQPSKNVVRFDEAPDFDTAREPMVGTTVTVYLDNGTTKLTKGKAYNKYIWHHKWQWVRDDYEGFDVGESWNWSKRWLSVLTEPSDGNGIGRWEAQLDKFGLPHDGGIQYSTRLTRGQKYTGEDTSVLQIPGTFTHFEFPSGTRILDYGGGQFNFAKDAVEKTYPGVSVEVMDAFNRTSKHNDRISDEFDRDKADAVTVNNVLNVIDSRDARIGVIEQAKRYLKHDGVAYFLMYQADKKADAGEAKGSQKDESRRNYQTNMDQRAYIPEIKEVFDYVTEVRSGGDIYLLASNIPLTKEMYKLSDQNSPQVKYLRSIKGNREEKAKYNTLSQRYGEATIEILDSEYENAANATLKNGEIGDTATIKKIVDHLAVRENLDKKTVRDLYKIKRDADGKVIPLSQRVEIHDENIRYSTRAQELDNEYREALDAKNEDWQLMLVDQAAYEAGYTTTAYHGSPFTDINVFNTRSQVTKKTPMQLLFGTHFTQSLDYAKLYAQKAKNSKGTSRMTTKTGRVYKTYLDLGKSLDLRTPANITPGTDEYKLYEDAPAKYKKKYPPYTFSKYDTEQGLGSGQYITKATIENVLQAMSPKDATDFLIDHGYNSVLYDANYATPTTGNNRFTRDPSIIMLDPERIKSGDPVTYDDNGNVIPLSERFNSENEDIRFSQRNVDIDARIDALVKKYGAMPTGEHPQRSEQLPKQTSDGKNLRRFARTVWESGITTDDIDNEIKKAIIDESLSYEVKTDEEAAEYASSVIRIGGVERAQKEWDKARRSDTFNKDHMALGQFLLKEYAKNNDVENAMKMIQELAAEGTRMGQNIQAMRMLKKYSQKVPAIGLGYIQRTVDQMNRDAKRKMGKKFQKMEIDQKLADAYLNAKTQDEIDSAIADIYIDLGSQVQKTTTEDVVDRLRTWRYMAMLGNPRTHIRNLVGNALFVPAVQMKNAIGAGLEGTMKTKTRTKAVRISKEAAAFAKQDALEMKDRLSGRQDMSIRDLIMEQRKVFSSKALNTLSEKNSQALEAEDWIFLRRHYENSLAQYITANKLDTTQENPAWLGKARNYAVLEAQKATYRDANKVSAWLNQSGKAGTVVKYMMEGMLPFKKTPTNILRRGVEYSPAGLVATLTKGTRDLNTGKITVNEWIDGVSSGLTGTAIFGLGMFLASTGAILGGYDDDDDKELRKLKGLQEYSVRIGNKTYTIDWAAPGSLPLFIGVETMSALQSERGVTMDDMGKSVMRMIDPMINMSMLSGLNDTLDAISYSDNKLSAAAMETFYSLLGQYVPTLFGQVARTIDTTQRINYQDKNKGMSKDMLYFIEKMQNKIPFLTFSNDPYLNEFGQENDSGPHWAAALQNFVSPGYISSVKDDKVINEIERLQEAQEENVLPKKMPKYLGAKENRVDLTSEQYTLFQRTAGQTAYNILDRMIDDRRYDRMNADEQAAAIKMAYDYAKAVGRIAVQPEYESDLKGDTKKIYNAVKDRKQAFSAILDLCAEKKEKKKSK